MPRRIIDREQQKLYQRTHYKRKKQYYKDKAKDRKTELKKWFQDYRATLKCAHCPENHPACLDFHHSDPSKKERDVTKMVASGVGMDRILEEIAKCIVLCSNCHRKHHAQDVN
jgi:hypothetical protein